jgi:hypothetical protein
MDNIKRSMESYLLTNSEQDLALMINRHFYNIVLKLLKRNGIYGDRFSYSDFSTHLFIALNENRGEIISLISENRDNFFVVISRITNIILRDLNRIFYRDSVLKDKEVYLDETSLSNIEISRDRPKKFGANDLELRSKSKERDQMKALIILVLERYSYKNRVAIEMYIGFDRSYRLSVDQICKIINIKRSTLFLNIKNFKERVLKSFSF